MAKIYYDKDAKLSALKGKTVAVDSGVNVIVADLPGSDNFKLAQKHGFKPVTCAEAVKKAFWVQMLVPDELQAIIYKNDVAPNLKKGMVLGFSHGFNIRFGQIKPPATIDVVMVAPKGPGHLVRDVYVAGGGVPNLIAVYQNASKKAKALALAYSRGIGGTRAGTLETTFSEETETDLFGEQVVLCGGVVELVKAGFETLVEAGYQPEIAYFECFHELKLIVDLMHTKGIGWMNYSISDTAEYGEYSRGPRIITEETKKEMKKILREIVSGEFAKEWLLENRVGRPVFNQARKESFELRGHSGNSAAGRRFRGAGGASFYTC